MQRCYKCNGKGKIRDEIDWFLGAMSLGLTALMDASNWHRCSACDGDGYLNDERNDNN